MRVRAHLELDSLDDLQCLLSGLALACEAQVRKGLVPALYQSGVRYKREARDTDGHRLNRWQTAEQSFKLKTADCEDLSAWRVGELNAQGERATIHIKRVNRGLLHIQVRRADGTIEDPSKKLGM